MNAVEGGIKDADHDYKMDVKNIARSTGVKVTGDRIHIPRSFKAFGLGIRFFTAVLVFIPFVTYGYPYHLWQLIALGLVLIGVIALSAKLITITTFHRNTIRKYIAAQSFLRYSLVPILLVYQITLLPTVILIVLPIIWYLLCAPLLGEKLLRPRM